MSKFRSCAQDSDQTFKAIADKVMHKLQSYDAYINSNISNLSKTVDPRLGNAIIIKSDLLCSNIAFPTINEFLVRELEPSQVSTTIKKSIVDELLEENSLCDAESGNNDILMFVKVTAILSRRDDAKC